MDTLPVNIPGFVWAYRFSPDEKTAVRLNNRATVADLTADNCFYWLHLNLVDARVPALLETLTGLTEDAKSALTTRDTHATITVDEQMLYGTLVDCQRDFDQDTNNLGWLHFAMSDRFIITTRLQPLRSVERARALIEKNPGKFSRPVDLFELLVIEFQRTLIAIVMELTEELNLIEDFVYDNAPRDERRRLAPVRRTVVRLHRHLRTVLALMRRAAADEPAGNGRPRYLRAAGPGAPVARRNRFQAILRDQPPPLSAVDHDGLPAAANPGDRLLRHEHRKPALRRRRLRHRIRRRPHRRVDCLCLVAAAAGGYSLNVCEMRGGRCCPSSACRHQPGSSHGSRPVLRTPVNGAKGICRNVSVPR
ncbi:hypothetical protein JOH51_004567 [Rhizobium leguminosarum]|nr:hypothetical protein [Rhizobium leguminosarum]